MSSSSALNEFTETNIRHGFIRKVYGILAAQLTVTMAIAFCVMRLPIAASPSTTVLLMFGSLAITVGVMCCFICKPEIMRRSPQNYILLAVFTVAQAVAIGFISAQYTQESVLMVLAITAIVVFGLTLFACQTSIDFTGMGAYLFAALFVLLGFGFVLSLANLFGAAGPAFQGLRLLYAVGGALIFSMFLVYDTQLIIGGKHQKKYDTDDYIPATLDLYLDIINLFLFLLQIFGDRQ